MKIVLTIITVISSISLTFAAGGVDGGGGKGVVCRNDQNQIIKAEVLDIYEGRVQYGHRIPSSSSQVMSQADEAIRSISSGRNKVFQDSVLKMAHFINLRKIILPDGTGLEDIDDSHHVIVPKGCKIEQLANFTKQNQILIDGEIWKNLDNTNKAALLVHEALYKWFRNYGATHSIRARKFVSLGFMGIEANDIKADIPADALYCHTLPNENGSPYPGTQFRAYNNQDGELIFQFDYLEGGLILTKSTVMIDKILATDLNKIGDVTYWLGLSSNYEDLIGVTISFQHKMINGIENTIKKIGLGNMPDMPDQQFECSGLTFLK
jgi:hypothetical protein